MKANRKEKEAYIMNKVASFHLTVFAEPSTDLIHTKLQNTVVNRKAPPLQSFLPTEEVR